MGLGKSIQSGDYEHGDILIEYAGDKYANEQGDTDQNDHHDKCDPVELRLFFQFRFGSGFGFDGFHWFCSGSWFNIFRIRFAMIVVTKFA